MRQAAPPPRDTGAGRALPEGPAAQAPAAQHRPAATRFAGHALQEAPRAQEGRAGVIAAVVALAACSAGGVAAGIAIWLVAAWRDGPPPPMAVADGGHDVAGHNTEEIRRRPSGTAAAAPIVDAGPQPAPVTLELDDEGLFHEMEVSCSGATPYRARAAVRRGVATVPDVPPGVVCDATFKGSEPVVVPVRAGDHKRCTLRPTICTPVR